MFSEIPVSAKSTGGCVNFITGAGGLLQSVLFGYGGIRYRKDQMDLNPTKLPNTTSWAMRGVKYRDVSFDVEVHGSYLTVYFKRIPYAATVEVKLENSTTYITQGRHKLPVKNTTLSIKKQLIILKVHELDLYRGTTPQLFARSTTTTDKVNACDATCHRKLSELVYIVIYGVFICYKFI